MEDIIIVSSFFKALFVNNQILYMIVGRKVAIDASMALYQFLVAVRSSSNGNSGSGGYAGAMMLTNEAGEVTSHIQGSFSIIQHTYSL